MSFVPRIADDITLGMAARVVARSKLTDIGAGSDLRFTLQAVGEEIALVEQRIKGVRDSFNILNPNITMADLEERLLELPTPQARQLATTAAGAVLTVSRSNTAAQQTLPAGSTFSRADGAVYKTTQAYTFGINVVTLTNVSITAVVPGKAGNCQAGEISTAVNAPSWITSVSNAVALTNGINAETKQQVQARVALYLQSLARSQPAAIGYAALSFISTAGAKLKFAKQAVDPSVPGRTQLVVDDGTGMAGSSQPGATVSATVPVTGIRTLWHEGPATAPIAHVVISPVSGNMDYFLVEGVDYDSIYERGLVRLRKQTVLQAGDVWTISNYSVYTGVIRELQRELDGDPSDPVNKPGWVAAGCRVFVQPPVLQTVSFDVHVVPLDGYDIAALVAATLAVAEAFTQTLGPGEPLFVAHLVQTLMGIGGMRNVHVFQPNTATPLFDVYADETVVLRGVQSSIQVFPTLPT